MREVFSNINDQINHINDTFKFNLTYCKTHLHYYSHDNFSTEEISEEIEKIFHDKPVSQYLRVIKNVDFQVTDLSLLYVPTRLYSSFVDDKTYHTIHKFWFYRDRSTNEAIIFVYMLQFQNKTEFEKASSIIQNWVEGVTLSIQSFYYAVFKCTILGFFTYYFVIYTLKFMLLNICGFNFRCWDCFSSCYRWCCIKSRKKKS